jgi:spore maturation protein SpmB
MQELDKLNPQPGTATNAMALFLAINTSSVTLLPSGVIALRAAAGSSDPAAILPTTLFATIGSTIVAVIAAKVYQRFVPFKGAAEDAFSETHVNNTEDIPLKEAADEYPMGVSLLALAFLMALIPVAVVYGRSVSPWILPALMVGFLGFGLIRRVRVYEVFVEGAKDGFRVAVRIIPYLVAILVAVDMLRASGVMKAVAGALGGFTGRFGLPAEALPMALMRPLSGSGAYGILASIINNPAIGPDSYTGYLVSTLQGSTETTFYVMAVYFGAVQVRRIRHSLAAGLTADVAAVIFSILACTFFLR